MLGKGLESLIPQKGGTGDGPQGNNNVNANPNPAPQGGGVSPAPQASNSGWSKPVWQPSSALPDENQTPKNDPPSYGFGGDTPPPLEFPILNDELELPEGNEMADEEASGVRRQVSGEEKKENTPAFSLSSKPAESVVNRFSGSAIPVAARNTTPIGVAPAKQAAYGEIDSRGPASADAATAGKPYRGPAVAASVFHIETEKIVPNPNQPRRHFDENALNDMAISIREFGILQPLVVTRIKKETPHGVDVEYELIAGERRLKAAKLLGLKTVPAIVRNVDLEREKLELAVIENVQREDLNPLEIARSYERLRAEFKLTQREIAAKLGKSREVVANTVRLLDLPTYAQEALERGQISESNARFLLVVGDQSAQRKLFDDIIQHGLTTRDVKERVALMENGKRKRGRPAGSVANPLSPELRAVQDELSSELGAPVEIQKKADTGKITITFYSEEELENILRKIKEGN